MPARPIRCIAALLVAASLAACAPSSLQRDAPDASVTTIPRATDATACRPPPDVQQPQHVVGYGSLMQDESRMRTAPKAGPASPVEVQGFRRGWFARVDAVGFSTTYLGVHADAQSRLNAVVYAVDADELAATDRREASYCRIAVTPGAIRALQASGQPPIGQVWIYVSKPESAAAPSAKFPIVQSYVDIFISGCLEQEQRFALSGFARQCVTSTQGWSEHWVNDRIHPRRPFIHQPKARQIDTLLSHELPDTFARIRIE